MNSDKKRELDRKKSELEILMVKPEDFENALGDRQRLFFFS